MSSSHGSGQGDRPNCPQRSVRPRRQRVHRRPYLEVAWVDGSSSRGHRVYAAAGRNVIGHGWAYTDHATRLHGGEPIGLWVQLDEQHQRPISPEPPEASDYVVCRGFGTDFTRPKETAMSSEQPYELERRLQQIAQRISPCPVPDAAEGWDLCAHGLPWPCPTTEAAWIARDLGRDERIRAAQRWLQLVDAAEDAYAQLIVQHVDHAAAILGADTNTAHNPTSTGEPR